MKKVLLTTAAVAFAGSAMAADVSGYNYTAYKSVTGDSNPAKNIKSLYTYATATVSGSKTASNGITFGGSSTIVHGATSTSAEVKANSFVSGSFGRIDMGKHNGASETHGAHTTYAGNGPFHDTDIGETDSDNVAGITYSTPSFNGVSAAYSMKPGENKFKSMGINFSGSFSGLNVTAAYGTEKAAGAASKTKNAWGVKVGKGAFSGSYGQGNDKAATPTKTTRMGVGYSAGKVSVGYSRKVAKKDGAADVKTSLISASYTVASGLTALVERSEKDKVQNLMIGTAISF